jgi:hypothetical protein
MTELEKMDALKSRLNITYKQAKDALDAANGDLAQALINLEIAGAQAQAGPSSHWGEPDKGTSGQFVRSIIEQIKAVIQEGNVTKVRLKNKDRVLIEIPATMGVVGLGVMLFSPLMLALGAAGAITAVNRELILEIEKSDGSIEQRNLKWPDWDWCDAEEDSAVDEEPIVIEVEPDQEDQ